jgi:TIR domain
MPRVFINYRTGDGEFAAALLDLQLSAEFGADNVFLASRTIAPGSNFEQTIVTQLRACTTVLAVVGRRWLDSSSGQGLHAPDDWVRRELLEAMERDILIIPVLLDDTGRLTANPLPAELADLAKYQYVRLRHRHAGDDVAKIVRALRAADDQLLSVLEADLRAYLTALERSMSATQSWMPYPTMDSAYLDRLVTVHGEAPAGPPDGGLYQDGNPLRAADVRWAQAIRDVPIGVVLGDAGLGKTWLLRYHCIQLCRAALAQLDSGVPTSEVNVPLFTHAHQLAAQWHAGLPPREALVRAATHGLDAGTTDLVRLLGFLSARFEPNQPSVYLLVDALDEVFDDELRDAAMESLAWVSGLVRVDSGPRLLLTARTAGFTDPFAPLVEGELDEGDEEQATPTYFQLGVLDEHQVRRLWSRWFELRAIAVPEDRLQPALAPGSAIRMAVRVPLVAAFAAWVAESESVTPNRSGLYAQVVDRFFGLYWKMGSPAPFGALRQDAVLRARYRRAFVDLAWLMATGSASWRDAVALDECELALDPALTGLRGEYSHTFVGVRGFGILVQLGGQADGEPATIAWIHRSVHQFLVATRLITLPASDLAELVDERCWLRPEWGDVLDFAIGLEAADPPERPVTTVVRDLALDREDGLGWFATVFTSAGAGMSPDGDDRAAVVAHVWRLYQAGLLTTNHLVQVLALTPEADPAMLANMVLTNEGSTASRLDTWTALTWCGSAGVAALRSAVAHAVRAEGAALALYQVAPDEAVAAVRERLGNGLPMHARDAVVLRDLSIVDVEYVRNSYRSRPSSVALAQCLGWTVNPAARADLMTALRAHDAEVRGAAVHGLIAGFAAELDELGCQALLDVALRDPVPALRLQARDALFDIGADVPWVHRRLDDHHAALYRNLPGPVEDTEDLVQRLREPGPGTDLALMMIREAPELLSGAVKQAMTGLTAHAMDGKLSYDQTEHVAAIFGDQFVDLIRERLDGTVRLAPDRLRTLIGGMCQALPYNADVFEAIVDCVAWNPDPALGIAMRLHKLAALDKANRLLSRLLALRKTERAAVQIWTDVLWETLLEVPAAVRAVLRPDCALTTRHLLDLLGDPV